MERIRLGAGDAARALIEDRDRDRPARDIVNVERIVTGRVEGHGIRAGIVRIARIDLHARRLADARAGQRPDLRVSSETLRLQPRGRWRRGAIRAPQHGGAGQYQQRSHCRFGFASISSGGIGAQKLLPKVPPVAPKNGAPTGSVKIAASDTVGLRRMSPSFFPSIQNSRARWLSSSVSTDCGSVGPLYGGWFPAVRSLAISVSAGPVAPLAWSCASAAMNCASRPDARRIGSPYLVYFVCTIHGVPDVVLHPEVLSTPTRGSLRSRYSCGTTSCPRFCVTTMMLP